MKQLRSVLLVSTCLVTSTIAIQVPDVTVPERWRVVELADPATSGTYYATHLESTGSGDLIVAAGWGYLRVWNLGKQRVVQQISTPDDVHKLAITSKNKIITTDASHLYVWDLSSGKNDFTFNIPVAGAAVDASPDGRYLALALSTEIGDADMPRFDLLKLFDLEAGKEVLSLDRKSSALALRFSPLGDLLVVDRQGISALSLTKRTEVRIEDWSPPYSHVAFTSDASRLIYTVARQGGDSINALQLGSKRTTNISTRLESIRTITISRDGMYAVGSPFGGAFAELFDLGTEKSLGTIALRNEQVRALTFVSRGRSFVLATSAGRLLHVLFG